MTAIRASSLPASASLELGRSICRGDRFSAHAMRIAWRERREAIIADYAMTRSLAATARAFGISRQRVSQILHRKAA